MSSFLRGGAIFVAAAGILFLLSAGGAFAAPPANDNLANAIQVSPPPATAAVSTVDATVENLEPAECNTTTVDKTAWFKYTPAESQTLVADTSGSNFDTALVVYSGPSSPTFGTLTYVSCNDDAFLALHSRVVFNASGGTTYYFQAGGRGSTAESGNLVFNLNAASPPPNDDLATASSVSLEAGASVNTAAATVETTEWLECDNDPVGKTVWFKYTSPADQLLIADTFGSAYDTILSVYSGPPSAPSFETLFNIGCNNHTLGFQSQVSFSAYSGSTYYFQAGGAGNQSGSLVFTLHGAPDNDDLAAAEPISPPATRSLSTTSATVEDSEPPVCQTAAIGNTAWFKYTAPASQTLIADTFGSGFDTVLAVYSGPSSSPSFGTLTPVACNDDASGGLQSQVVFNGSSATTYYFQAGGYASASGSLVFNLNADTDGDGVLDASDNCPAWANAAQNLPDWTVPADDADCDGFNAAREAHVGTNPAKHCNDDNGLNNEPDAWPTDFNDSQNTNLSDVVLIGPSYNKSTGQGGYNQRFDLSASNSVSLSDVVLIGPFYNKGCA